MWQTTHWLEGMVRVQAVLDGVAFLGLTDGGIGRGAKSQVAPARIGPGVGGVTIVGVDHVAGGAAGTAIIAGLIVGAEKIEQRVEEAWLRCRPWKTGSVRVSVPKPRLLRAVVAALEDAAACCAGLCGLEVRQRPEFGKPTP